MKLITAALTLISLLFFSCTQPDPNKQIDEGKVHGTTYESKEIGWIIEIPEDWKITSKDKIEANDEKGKRAIEKSTGVEIDTKTLKHLISFQKDRFNIFNSTSQPFSEKYPGEYQESFKGVCELIYNAYIDLGLKVDSTSGKETIQGLEFNKFCTTLYAPDGKEMLNQVLYSRLINGYDFGVNINYNNDEAKKVMMMAFKKSRFIQN